MAATQVSLQIHKNTLIERWFFTCLALAMIATATAGFLPSLVNTSGRRAPLSPLAAAHGIVFFLWLAIFLTQSRLVASGRITLHRRLGVVAACLLPVMIPLGYETTISMAHRGFDLSGDLKIDHDPLYEIIFPLGDVFTFSVLVMTAIAYRRQPEIHKRLMLFANIALMGAPLAHFIGHIPWLAALPPAIILVPISMFLLAAVAREYLLARKINPLTLGLALAMFASGPIRAGIIGPSAAWHRLAGWLAR